jgi:hypothetical protein
MTNLAPAPKLDYRAPALLPASLPAAAKLTPSRGGPSESYVGRTSNGAGIFMVRDGKAFAGHNYLSAQYAGKSLEGAIAAAQQLAATSNDPIVETLAITQTRTGAYMVGAAVYINDFRSGGDFDPMYKALSLSDADKFAKSQRSSLVALVDSTHWVDLRPALAAG